MNHDLYAEALVCFRELLDEARASADPEPTAMTLATVDAAGRVAARTVLLKAHDERGFVFYTNLQSRKGRELQSRPQAALLFHWKTLRNQVQVRIEGRVEPVDGHEADVYFASRPRPSQVGAWASLQSEPLPSREEFERRLEEVERRYAGVPVPRPPHWSGFRLQPLLIEFWQDQAFRLHDRLEYRRAAADQPWTTRTLYP